MKTAFTAILGSLMASEAFMVPAALSRASIAGGFAARQVVSCSAASSQSRVAFLVQAGLVAGAAVASAASPVIALAEGDGEEEEVQVGKEVTTGSGLKYVVTVAGKGAKPNPGDTIKAHYTGWLDGFGEDGRKFDSSRDRGRPFTFRVGKGMVIKGWDEALGDMKIGERRQITVPAQLGYGSRGAGGVIPPDATLYFDIELLGVQPA